MCATSTTPLAPYAVAPDALIGRVHSEPPSELRDPFELDRHRILASTAFRRLQYKTQVFVIDAHDHFRTRLTHTLEVADIARTLAGALRVNERLAEAVALAHDLGHAPFGHAGEAALGNLMADHGGFEHNLQSLRVVNYLEHPHPQYRGLNLCFEVREGLIKHVTTYDKPQSSTDELPEHAELLATGPHPTVEAQIVSLADRIAYNCHDLEDAIGARLIGEGELSGLTLWRDAHQKVRQTNPSSPLPAVRRPVLDGIVERLLTAAISETASRLKASAIASPEAARTATLAVVAFPRDVEILVGELELFLRERVYRHERLVQSDADARRRIDGLFTRYIRDPRLLPERFTARIDQQGAHRVVCDYVSGMTDRFCLAEYDRLVEPSRRK